MRLVLDTNIVIAALLWKGAPRQLLSSIAEGRASCFSSTALLGELARSLQYPKFAHRIGKRHLTAQALVERYTRLARLVMRNRCADAADSALSKKSWDVVRDSWFASSALT